MTSDPPQANPPAAYSRTTRLMRRAIVELGYLVFLFVILELTLRLAGFLWLLPRTLAQSSLEPESGEIRILAIGESTTFGLGVQPEESYPAVLETLLRESVDRPVRAINVGVPGQTSTSILRTIRHQLDLHRPHLVLGLFGVNDTNEALNDLASRVVFGVHVPEWVANLRVYRLACIVRDYALHAPKFEDHGAWTFFDRDQRGEDCGWVDNPFYLEQLKLNAGAIIGTVRSAGAEYIQLSYLRSNAPLRETLKEIAEVYEVDYIDLFSEETETKEEFFTEDGFHPNVEGHRLMAERIAAGLLRLDLIPPE